MSTGRSKTYKVIFDIITWINITLILKKYWRFQNDWHLNNYILYLRPRLWCSTGRLQGCWPSASWNGDHCVPGCKIPKGPMQIMCFRLNWFFYNENTVYFEWETFMMWSLHNFLLICAPFHRKRRHMVNKYFQPCACYCIFYFCFTIISTHTTTLISTWWLRKVPCLQHTGW